MSLIKQLAGETAIYGLSSILSRLLNYVIMASYLTRAFSRAEYGVVSELYAYVALLMVIFTYRMETTFFRFGSESKQMPSTFSTASISLLVTTSILVASMLLFSGGITDFLQYSGHSEYVIWFTLILGLDTLAAIPFARLRLENRPIRFAIIKTLNILVNIFFLLFFLEACPYLIERGWSGLSSIYDADNRIVYVFIANFMGSLVVLLLLLPQYFGFRWTFDSALWKRMMWYAAPLVVVGLAAVINQLINLPLLKSFLPYSIEENLAKVGEYGACSKIAILMSLFIQAFNYAAEPFFFRNAKRKDSKEIYAQVGQVFAMVGSLVFLGVMLYLDLIKIIIDEEFHVALFVVPILLIAFLFLGLYYNFSIWYKLADRTIIGAYISVAGALITLVLNITLIPLIGYAASAWAALACYAFMALVSYYVGQKYYPIPYPIGRILGYILLAVSVYGLSTLIPAYWSQNLWVILTANTLLLLGFVGVLYNMERKTLRSIFS